MLNIERRLVCMSCKIARTPQKTSLAWVPRLTSDAGVPHHVLSGTLSVIECWLVCMSCKIANTLLQATLTWVPAPCLRSKDSSPCSVRHTVCERVLVGMHVMHNCQHATANYTGLGPPASSQVQEIVGRGWCCCTYPKS